MIRTSLPEVVIRAEDPPPGLLVGLREVFAHRELLWALGMREVRVRYKQSLLGVAWAAIQPLTMMFIFTVVFGRFARLPSEGVPYPVFSYAALLPWNFFSSATSSAITSVAGGGALIKKVYFPRAVLPLSSMLTSGVDFLVSAGVFGLLLAYYKVSVGWHLVYVAPLLLLQVAFMIGVSLLLGAFNAYYRDVRYVLPIALQVWLYATPVVWSMSMVPAGYRLWYALLNPMAAVVEGWRAAVLRASAPDALLVGAASATALLVLFVGYRYFCYVERNFADVI
ncbi:MAG: ABC transporter permease [Armatimonadota bacterium]|nr:ABC transporter permease [Armatimonadota bacterium]MDR7443538.1 ABC transporter permease [Armatimonadota bacterium]MDR7570371.1 ABC transporter permease [Armatimonadota bacterium]MDR7615037.1 ABC transporter permease [Armatimonadota bacterium]